MYRKSFKATTLPELLVVMVIGGIVFTAAFEAWDRVGSFGGRWSRRVAEKSSCFTAIACLERLFVSADSVVVAGEGVLFRKVSGGEVELQLEDGCLTAVSRDDGGEQETGRDTLFRQVKKIYVVRNRKQERTVDSLYVFLVSGKGESVFGYGLPGERIKDWEAIFRREERHTGDGSFSCRVAGEEGDFNFRKDQ